MLMLDNAVPVSVGRLAEVPCPAPTETWRPYPHAEVVATLSDRMTARGLKVRASKLTLVDGAMYPEKGVREEVPGARLFGTFDLEPGGAFVPGAVPSIGLRNSTDKSYALTVLIGMRVMACSNGVLYVERGVQVSRRHTSGLELEGAFDDALDAYERAVPAMTDLYETLRGQRLSLMKAKARVVDCAAAGAIPSAHILPVVREFEEPSVRAFRGDRSLWGLYNAVTHASFKRMSPQRMADGYRALNEVLVGEVN
jgi:hypothetical protein